MRKIIITAVATCLLAGSAFAATHHATGMIKQIDSKSMTLTLSDGSVYSLPPKFKTANLKTGEKVSVAWDQTGQSKMATAVTPVK